MVATCRGLGEPREWHAAEVDLPSISGTAFLVPRVVLERIGAFEEALHLYVEDTDLSLRALLAGYRCVTAPESLVRHKYQLKMGPSKFFYIERNRWLVMLRVYRWRTLLLLLPGLLAIEAMTWVGAAMLGPRHLLAKGRSYASIIGMAATIRRGRGRVQALRGLSDRALLRRLQGPLPVDQLVPRSPLARGAMEVANGMLGGYFRLARLLVRW